MSYITPDFLYVCDAPFAPHVALGVKAIRTFYRNSKIFVYDLSETPSEAFLEFGHRDDAVEIIWHPPSKWVEPKIASLVDFDYFHPRQSLKDRLKTIVRHLRYLLTGQAKENWIVDKSYYVAKRRRFIRIIAQKPYCIADCLSRDGRPLVFLDADAFLIAPFLEMKNWNCDVAVTLRRLPEIKIGIDHGVAWSRKIPFHAVNAGVIFFFNTAEARSFVAGWLKRTLEFDYFMVEQTALSQMLLDADPDAFDSYFKTIRVGDTRVLTLPCETYNNTYYHPQRNEIPNDACVVHYKGGHKQSQFFDAISSRIENHLAGRKTGAARGCALRCR